AGCLAVSSAAPIHAEEEAPGIATVGQTEPGRPTELPPFLTPPPSTELPKSNPPPKDNRPRGPADYNPAYNYLPDRNPGARHPPCPCLPLGRVWIEPAYFLGTTDNDGVPPLVTGSRGGRTATLYGGSRIDHDFRSGLRLDAGAWLDRCQTVGIEGRFF